MKETENVSNIDITRRRGKVYGSSNKKTKSYALTSREAMHCVRRSYLDELRKEILTPTYHPPPNSHKGRKRKHKRSIYVNRYQTYRDVVVANNSSKSKSNSYKRKKNKINTVNNNYTKFYPSTSRYNPQQRRHSINYHSQNKNKNKNKNKKRHNHQQYQRGKRITPPKSARSNYHWNNNNMIQPPHLNIVRKVKKVIKSSRNRNDIKTSSYPQKHSYPLPPKYSRQKKFKRASGIKQINGNNNNHKYSQPIPPKYKPNSKNYNGRKRYNKRIIC